VPKNQTKLLAFLTQLPSPRTNSLIGASSPELSPFPVTELIATAPAGVTCVSLGGKVEVARKDSPEWHAIGTNDMLSVGDRLRTGRGGRAVVRMQDQNLVRVGELTTMEILAGKETKLEEGQIYMFDRKSTNSFQIRTPSARARVKG
jgi:hypothetical protein